MWWGILVLSLIFYMGGVFTLSLFKGVDTKWSTIFKEAAGFVIGVWASLFVVLFILTAIMAGCGALFGG